ncbi:ABC transporter ATP-binding protein [Micrococcales bacterium 31B]|nr:ABC transporter ATP-binding protein [Micrococcales bacterium 31B]
MIETLDLVKRYGTQVVVDRVTLDLQPGGVTSIIGPNGAGKSTLLGMISRLLAADGGTVSIDGLDVTRTPSREIAKKLAILRQDNHLALRLTVRELVTFGRYPHSKGRPTVEDRDHVERSLAFFDLEGLAERHLDELSGGQRQRAFVAMVMCQDTDYVLLDEPLNNLDMYHAVDMMTVLRRAAVEFGKTIVIVIHDVNFASVYSDTIVAMKRGELVHRGTPAQIMTPEVLRDVYDMEIPIHEVEGRRIAVFFEAARLPLG